MTSPRIGVCTWSLGPEGPKDLSEKLRRVEIDAVQLALVPLLAEPRVWSGALDTLDAAGVRVFSGMLAMAGEDYTTLESIRRTGGVRPDDTWPDNRRRALEVARLAGDEGIALVTFHAGFLPPPEDPVRRVMIDRLRAVADGFADQGVRVALETGQETAETLAGVLAELEGVGVNFDPANMILYAMGDGVAALGRLAPLVRQVHIKDDLPRGPTGKVLKRKLRELPSMG